MRSRNAEPASTELVSPARRRAAREGARTPRRVTGSMVIGEALLGESCVLSRQRRVTQTALEVGEKKVSEPGILTGDPELQGTAGQFQSLPRIASAFEQPPSEAQVSERKPRLDDDRAPEVLLRRGRVTLSLGKVAEQESGAKIVRPGCQLGFHLGSRLVVLVQPVESLPPGQVSTTGAGVEGERLLRQLHRLRRITLRQRYPGQLHQCSGRAGIELQARFERTSGLGELLAHEMRATGEK